MMISNLKVWLSVGFLLLGFCALAPDIIREVAAYRRAERENRRESPAVSQQKTPSKSRAESSAPQRPRFEDAWPGDADRAEDRSADIVQQRTHTKDGN